MNGVDPQAYFADVLTKLVNLWPASRLDELMPWAWDSSNQIAAPGAGCRMMADTMAVWSSFLASPEAPKTAMSPLELDGYLTGILVTPRAAPMMPSEWLPRLWGHDEPIFDDDAQIKIVLGAVMKHHNALITAIDRSLNRLETGGVADYQPLFLSDNQTPMHESVRTWVRGFLEGHGARPRDLERARRGRANPDPHPSVRRILRSRRPRATRPRPTSTTFSTRMRP